jgi:glycogen phosphorylase
LAPIYSSGRMARDYVEQYYLAGAAELRRRTADASARARAVRRWEVRLQRHWPFIRIATPTISRGEAGWLFSVTVALGEIAPADVAVQLYAEPCDGGAPFVGELFCTAPDASLVYTGAAPADRPAQDYTVRIVPCHPGAAIPAELSLIMWQT